MTNSIWINNFFETDLTPKVYIKKTMFQLYNGHFQVKK